MADAVLDLAGIEGSEQTETPVEQSTEQTTETPQETQQAEQRTDGRRGLQAHRDAAKAAKELMPDHAKAIDEMASNSFRLDAYQKVYGKPEEAAAAKQLIEGVGGVEGITTLQQRSQQIDLQDGMLKDGNPEVLDAFFKDFPEGAAALAPHYLERLSKVDPQGFNSIIAPYAFGALESAGIEGHLQAMLQESDPARAKALTQQLANWYAQQKQGIQSLKTAPVKNGNDDRLKQRETELNQREEQMFASSVQEKVSSSVTPELDKVVEQYAKQYKLNDTQKVHFRDTLQSRLVGDINKDETYKQQVNLRRSSKGKTPDSVASYISGEFNRRIPAAAMAVAKDVYGAPRAGAQTTGVVKPDTPKTAPGGGPVFVTQRPQDSEFAQYPELEMDIIAGRARLKNGRYVTWRKA